jgi:hypothetical protein
MGLSLCPRNFSLSFMFLSYLYPFLLALSSICLSSLFYPPVSVVTLPYLTSSCRLSCSRPCLPFSLSFISLHVPCHCKPSPCPVLNFPFLQIHVLHVTIFPVHVLHIPSSVFQPSKSCVFTISLSSSLSVLHVPQPCSCSFSLASPFFIPLPSPPPPTL